MKNLEVFSIYSNFAAVFYMFRVMNLNYLIFDFKPNDSWLNLIRPQTFSSRLTQRKKSLSYNSVYNCHNHKEGGEI